MADCPDESYFPLGESYKPLASEAAIKAKMRPYCKLKMDQPRYTLLLLELQTIIGLHYHGEGHHINPVNPVK